MRLAFSGLDRDRIGSALAALAVQALIAALLLWGMGTDLRRVIRDDSLKLFDLSEPPPPPEQVQPQPPPRVESDVESERFAPREEGGASPPNLRARATEIVAPEPVVPLPVPPPVVTAPEPGTGAAPFTGSAEVRGPGTGSGGIGDGTGSGLGGGGGGGGGFGRPTPPRLIRGRLSDSDYPRGLGEAGVGGTVSIIFTVTVDGRATDCRIERSSGSAMLDAHTCRLVERRYLFEPSRDGRGRPIRSRVVEDHSWVVEDLPPEREPPRRLRRSRGW